MKVFNDKIEAVYVEHWLHSSGRRSGRRSLEEYAGSGETYIGRTFLGKFLFVVLTYILILHVERNMF